MKLRMAENSLFAILLRSPWWVSFAVAGVIGLLAVALLPRTYAIYGMAGGFPFVVVGTIAMVRQLRAPSAAQVSETLQALAAMPWNEFAATVEQAFRLRGYEVRRSAHPGADFEASDGTRRAVISCKRWKAASHGTEPLRELQRSRDAGDAQEAIYIAIKPPSTQAARLARDTRIELIQDVALVQLVLPALRARA
ncbi:MAG TPA: restriction endonuclease [Noviherbaspirillum sp.]|nr:restriction endonuclease [Noviherbaspirillum sp.]